MANCRCSCAGAATIGLKLELTSSARAVGEAWLLAEAVGAQFALVTPTGGEAVTLAMGELEIGGDDADALDELKGKAAEEEIEVRLACDEALVGAVLAYGSVGCEELADGAQLAAVRAVYLLATLPRGRSGKGGFSSRAGSVWLLAVLLPPPQAAPP